MASTYDPAADIVIDYITIDKTLNIYDSVNKIIYAASTHAVCYGDKYYY